MLEVIEFYAGPSPFEGECTFGYTGTGTASTMTAEVYNLASVMIWSSELTDVSQILWDGTGGTRCDPVANGVYLYTITATDETNTFTDTGKVFVKR